MIRKWLRLRRGRIEANRLQAERTRREAQRVRAQWSRVRAHSGHVDVDHVGDAVLAMIHHQREN